MKSKVGLWWIFLFALLSIAAYMWYTDPYLPKTFLIPIIAPAILIFIWDLWW